MPDANKNLAINSIVGAAFGGTFFAFLSGFKVNVIASAAGQRCMAVSVGKCKVVLRTMLFSTVPTAVIVGDESAWLPELINRAKALSVNGGFEKGADL